MHERGGEESQVSSAGIADEEHTVDDMQGAVPSHAFLSSRVPLRGGLQPSETAWAGPAAPLTVAVG